MRKIGILAKYIYRILVLKKGRSERKCIHSELYNGNHVDDTIKKILKNDMIIIEAKSGLKDMLEKRVMNKGRSFMLTKNSFADLLHPLFSFRHIELKMAGITLALVISLAIGPTGNYPINRNLHPVFLADTLIDSSIVHIYNNVDSAAY